MTMLKYARYRLMHKDGGAKDGMRDPVGVCLGDLHTGCCVEFVDLSPQGAGEYPCDAAVVCWLGDGKYSILSPCLPALRPDNRASWMVDPI